MIKKLEKIDEFLCHIENFLHGKDGEDCTEARKLIREVMAEAKNISSSPLLSKSVCEKYPYPIQMYCYQCEGCKKASIEQTV